MRQDEPWLWDRSGPADPELVELERLLGELRGPRRATLAPQAAVVPWPRRARWVWVAAAGLVVTLGLAWALADRDGAPEVRLLVDADGRVLREAEWFTATAESRHLTIERFGDLQLDPGSRLRVGRLAVAQTELWLQQGRLEAFVNLNARPRFFQVGTPAAKCVDLGCRYTLTVDDGGDSHVAVHSGQVAFENAGREVYIPAGATCMAWNGRGVGTPRFANAAVDLIAVVDALDRAAAAPAEQRRALVDKVLALSAAAEPRDSLCVWHLLQDPDPTIAVAAALALEQRFGRPPGLEASSGSLPTVADRELWKRRLERHW